MLLLALAESANGSSPPTTPKWCNYRIQPRFLLATRGSKNGMPTMTSSVHQLFYCAISLIPSSCLAIVKNTWPAILSCRSILLANGPPSAPAHVVPLGSSHFKSLTFQAHDPSSTNQSSSLTIYTWMIRSSSMDDASLCSLGPHLSYCPWDGHCAAIGQAPTFNVCTPW